MLGILVVIFAAFDVTALPKAHVPMRIEAVELAPVFQRPFVCGEHPQGSMHDVGDALGRDCMLTGGLDPMTSEVYPRPNIVLK